MARFGTTARRLLLAAAFLIILWQIWTRVHIVVFARLTDLALLVGILVVAFLLLDHYLNRERG